MKNTEKEKIPFFVYGTLMKDFRNYEWLLKNHVKKIEEATLADFSISPSGHGFPFMARSIGDIVLGQIMYVSEKEYEKVLESIDYLEGYQKDKDSLYKRIVVNATNENKKIISCWAYICERWFEKENKIESGSWKKYIEERRRIRK